MQPIRTLSHHPGPSKGTLFGQGQCTECPAGVALRLKSTSGLIDSFFKTVRHLKWCLFLIPGLVSPTVRATEKVRKTFSFSQFQADFKKFYAEPGWIVTSFVSLPLEEFEKAWELFAQTLRDAPWSFFVSSEKQYSEHGYREQFIAHCKEYDEFLKNLLVDVPNKRLLLAAGTEKADYLRRPGVITVFQYWQAKRTTLHHHFYAFYFDRIAAQLIETITTGYCQHDTTDYPALYKKAKELRVRLNDIFKRLKGGVYDARYAYHVGRYKEVLDVLQKERALQGGAVVVDDIF